MHNFLLFLNVLLSARVDNREESVELAHTTLKMIT